MENIEFIVNLIVNNGATIGVLVYFMYIQNTILKELKKSIDDMRVLIQKLYDEIDCIKKLSKSKEE